MPHGNMLFCHVSYTKTIQNEQCGYFQILIFFNIVMHGNTSFVVWVTKLIAW
jgi:hypothetical protein